MPKLNIDGIKASYDVIDCNKVVVLKLPHHIYNNQDAFNNVVDLTKCLKKIYNAKWLIYTVDTIDFETMDKDEAINKINDFINELNNVKEKLINSNEDD